MLKITRAYSIAAALAAICLFSLWSLPASAQVAPCMTKHPPTCELKGHVPLVWSLAVMHVVNIYWGSESDWTGGAHPSAYGPADIDKATQALLHSAYFSKTRQYKAPAFLQWAGSTTTDTAAASEFSFLIGACKHKPSFNNNSVLQVFDFLTCVEAAGPFANVRNSVGAPSGSCTACAITPNGCMLELLHSLDLGTALSSACLVTPNTSGDTLYNIFLPPGASLSDPGFSACRDYESFHYQIPSLPMGFPFDALVGTQGRPLYFTVHVTDCYKTLSDMMGRGVTHEMVETLLSPIPVMYWYDESASGNSTANDPIKIGNVAGEGEAADLCNGMNPAPFPAPFGTPPFGVAFYWSNSDHNCVPGGLPASTPAGPEAFNMFGITVTTGNDDARSDTELWVKISGQPAFVCLKPSNNAKSDTVCLNGPGTHDQTGQQQWPNWSSTSQQFPLAVPQTKLTGFETVTIQMMSHNSFPETDDKWNIQGIVVAAIDTKGVATNLLNISNARDGHNDNNCLIRLTTNKPSVTFKLNSSKPTGANPGFPPGNCSDS
jgi:hypothetical protein